MASLLKPEASLGVGAATATLVYAIYTQATPSIADIRTAPPGDQNIESARRSAAWTAAAIVAGISILAKDVTVFTIGGATVILMDWWTRHANQVNPLTGQAATVEPSLTAPSAQNGSDVQVDYAEGVSTY